MYLIFVCIHVRQAGHQGEGLVVASLAVDGPAEQSGLVRAGDVLVSIDRIDVRGMSAEDLAQYILGPPGSTVRLGFLRQASDVHYVELTRGWTMKRSGPLSPCLFIPPLSNPWFLFLVPCMRAVRRQLFVIFDMQILFNCACYFEHPMVPQQRSKRGKIGFGQKHRSSL